MPLANRALVAVHNLHAQIFAATDNSHLKIFAGSHETNSTKTDCGLGAPQRVCPRNNRKRLNRRWRKWQRHVHRRTNIFACKQLRAKAKRQRRNENKTMCAEFHREKSSLTKATPLTIGNIRDVRCQKVNQNGNANVSASKSRVVVAFPASRRETLIRALLSD